MSNVQNDVLEVFRRFIGAQNARDEASLTPLLQDGDIFLWVTTSGATVRGRSNALARFGKNWQQQWHLNPTYDELCVIEVSPTVALLHVPLEFTFAPIGELAQPTLIKWSGLFVLSEGRWVISAILLATVF